MKKSNRFIFSILGFVFLSACQNSVKQSSKSNLKKIDFVLGGPRIPIIGLYSKGKRIFKDAGLDAWSIKLPPEDSSSDLIINGNSIWYLFQDSIMVVKGTGYYSCCSYRRTQYVESYFKKRCSDHKSKGFGG